MNSKDFVENYCIQKISTIYRKMNIIYESKYIPLEQKSNLLNTFRSELQDTYKLCLPYFADSKTPDTK